ncbi:carboxylesterase family domain-containing protein [Phthorimaea operculella]|nr:carboxylesterase family domain-containing protein [Phthorimaea operculella]
MWYILVCSLFVLCAGQNIPVPEPLPALVTIKQGSVLGSAIDNGSYFEFHGIPYADSTSGTHRFKAPSPPPSFEETFVADRKDIKCVRALGVGYEGTEDCLVVNVFTPSLNASANLPVMVWVKGKEFDNSNEPELSFKHFVEKDVVVVTLNYRESILGYLCLGTEIAPGNAGLKDIIAGLRWVQENIVQFGGNPESVTLFGHGSGAAAVDLVTLSPMSNGLIHKAISQSGTAIAPWAVTRDNLEYAILVAEALGHSVTDIIQLSEVFTRTSVAALMAVINELDLTDNALAFAPCIERENLQGEEPFLIKSPYQTIVDGDFAQIPFITGYVDIEGTIRAAEADEWLGRMDSSFVDFIQPDLQFESEEERITTAQAIKTLYSGNQSLTIDEYLKYHGDTMVLVSAIREAQLRAAVSNSSVYLYQFSYKGALGQEFVQSPIEVPRAAHSEELAYFFYDDNDVQNTAELDLAVSDILIERWTNFAKTGVPTTESSTVVWEPFAQESSFLRILASDEAIEDYNIEGRYMECRNIDNAASKGRHIEWSPHRKAATSNCRHIERPPHRMVVTSKSRHIERLPHRMCITLKVAM